MQLAIHKKIFESGMTTLIISNGEINDMKIVKSLEETGLLKQSISETIKIKQKSKKENFSECYLAL